MTSSGNTKGGKMFYKIFSSFYSFFYKFRKQGFTLAEALIITVMTGACLLPILGTMQNAQVRTEKFDHQSKMQQYARSRLTAEIANAAFDHQSVNLDDQYYYIVYFASSSSTSAATEENAKLVELPKSFATLEDLASFNTESDHANWATAAVDLLGINRSKGTPYIKVVHAYKTSVETKDTPALTEYGNEGNKIESPKALLGIVVKTCLIKSNEDYYDPSDGAMITEFNENGSIKTKDTSVPITPVSLFAFVNLPTVSDEYIWMVASETKVIAFDPVSKTIANTLTFGTGDNEPRHVAVHPSGKMLAVQCKNYIYLVNIDVKSLKKNEKKVLFGGAGAANKFCEGPEEGGGIAFRTDGKVLYYTDFANKKLHMCEFNYTLADNADRILDWSDGSPSASNDRYIDFGNYGNRFTNLVAANDGYLYFGACVYGGKDDDLKAIYRYPMYTGFNETDTIQIDEIDKDIRNIDVSNNGRFLLCVSKGEENGYAKIYDTNTRNLIKTISTDKKITHGIFVSFSGSETDFKDNSLFIALSLKEKGANGKSYIVIYNFLDTVNPWAKLAFNQSTENGSLIASPIDSKIVFTSKLGPGQGNNDEKLLFFADYVFKHVDYEITRNEAVGLGEKKALEINKAELSAKKRNILAVAEGEATRTIQLYDLNSLKKLEDDFFIATSTVASLTMNSQGTMLFSSHDDYDLGFYQYNFLDYSIKRSDVIGSYSRKIVFDGSIPDMAFALMYEKDRSGNISSEYLYNLYKNDMGNRWETSSSDYYDRRNFKIPSGWTGLDIIGMADGGFLALYGKKDASGNLEGPSMLEWIGRNNWDNTANKGKYKLFARWTNVNISHSENIYPSYSNSLTSYNDESDGYSGMLVIDVDNPIPYLGSRIKSLNIYASDKTHPTESNPSWENEVAFMTPLILRKKTNGTFSVIDYAESIPLNCGKLYNDIEVKWKKNDGRISSDCHFGFWGGRYKDGISMKSRLGVAYKYATSNYHHVSDIFTDSTTSNSSALRTFSDFQTILNSDILQPISNYTTSTTFRRNYAVQFKTEPVPSYSNFPPLYSKKLVISPDCGTLGILSKAPSKTPVLSIFDFNNFNYGPETQVEGLLVDYRAYGRGGAEWPYEKDKIFRNVINGISFKDSTIPTFASATTKFESWQSFRAYPANYGIDDHIPDGDEHEVNKSKEQANKRFFGYFRPESDINFMQSYGSEDIRFFLNKHYIAGRKESASLFTLPISFSVKAFESGLFQKDEAFNNSSKGSSNIFIAYNNSDLANVVSDTSLAKPENDNPATYYYKIKDGKSFDYMNSCYTYILKNQPSFINSYLVNTDDGYFINMDYADMVFSRNRAKPTLYIKGENKLFVLYKNIFKMFAPGTGTNSKDIIISEDGQKLVFGKGNSLRVYNISNPTDAFFETGTINGPADNYLGLIATINTSIKPFFLAAKTYGSYSSSEIGGEYNLLATDSFKISANACAVASGGIYIAKSESSGIAVYNPLKNPTSVVSVGNFNSNAKSAAVAAYDDKLYLFGNSLSSIRIQNYDVNTKEALQSYVAPPVFDNPYWANVVAFHNFSLPVIGDGTHSDANGWSNAVTIVSGNNAPGFPLNFEDRNRIVAENAFDGDKDWSWRTSSRPQDYSDTSNPEPEQYVSYKVNYTSGLIVNSIYVDNNYYYGDDYGVKKFELYGINTGSPELLVSETMPSRNSQKIFNFDNEKAFNQYKFVCKSSFSGGHGKGVAEIKLMRSGLKRLTPSPSDSVTINSTTNFSWSSNNNYYSIQTSDIPQENYRVGHFYPRNYNINYYNNPNYSGTPEGWQSSCTSTVKAYILMHCSQKEILKVLRYTNTLSSSGYIKRFRVYGSKNTSVNPDPDDANSNWQLLSNLKGNGVFDNCPQTNKTWITYEINNDTAYYNYLFWIEDSDGSMVYLTGFELYGDNYSDPVDSLAPLKTDSLGDIAASDYAACSTPYGLVISGGFSGSNATSNTLLYWPHAVNQFDGREYRYGISRSLPEMKKDRANHVLVWHKGKIYAIGGREKTGDNDILDKSHFIEVLDYNKKLEWKEYPTSYKYIDGAADDSINGRYNHGACSFGDEIFIFGGKSSSSNVRTSAIAFNPETGTIRKLKDMHDVLKPDEGLNPCVAVTYGSKIYIIGNDKDNANLLKVIEYTP